MCIRDSNYLGFSMSLGENDSQERATGHPAAARRRHASPTQTALGTTGERKAAAVELGERGLWEGALPGTACSVPGKGGDPRREGFPRFAEACPSQDFFESPFLGFPVARKALFFRGWNNIIPRGFYFASPVSFQYVRTAVRIILQQ